MIVTAVCLTADRQEKTDRAVRCFLRQTHPDARLLIYDTGKKPYLCARLHSERILVVRDERQATTIGALRNLANTCTADAEILLHWDSDDWYHAERIARQVEDLQAHNNCGAVGWRDVLFYDSRKTEAWRYRHPNDNYAIGASLCYWRSAWERQPFENISNGEDRRWLRGVRSWGGAAFAGDEPLMIAEVHGKNTASHQALDQFPTPTEFQRALQWDDRAKKIMEVS